MTAEEFKELRVGDKLNTPFGLTEVTAVGYGGLGTANRAWIKTAATKSKWCQFELKYWYLWGEYGTINKNGSRKVNTGGTDDD